MASSTAMFQAPRAGGVMSSRQGVIQVLYLIVSNRKVGGFWRSFLALWVYHVEDAILGSCYELEQTMKKTDKFLMGIVGGILLLVVVAFSVALTTPEPSYQAEDTPEGVAFNYLFALQQGDYERAYGYLRPSLKGYPRNVAVFTSDIRDHNWEFSRLNDASVTLEVDSVFINERHAEITMLETRFYEGGLFESSSYTTTFVVTLLRDQNGVWKISESDNYWLWCWDEFGGCK
jgi:hypothetical protein